MRATDVSVIDNRVTIRKRLFTRIIWLFTVRKRSCRKVMFFHLSVILFTEGVYPSMQWAGGCTLADTPEADNSWADPPPPRRQLKRVVHILLECILVQVKFYNLVLVFVLFVTIVLPFIMLSVFRMKLVALALQLFLGERQLIKEGQRLIRTVDSANNYSFGYILQSFL